MVSNVSLLIEESLCDVPPVLRQTLSPRVGGFRVLMRAKAYLGYSVSIREYSIALCSRGVEALLCFHEMLERALCALECAPKKKAS